MKRVDHAPAWAKRVGDPPAFPQRPRVSVLITIGWDNAELSLQREMVRERKGEGKRERRIKKGALYVQVWDR